MQAPLNDTPLARIKVFVSGNCGYVWDAEGALRLRKTHRLMGSLVGGVSQFKNQNEVNALPLQLNADEVTHARRKGWISLHSSNPRVAVAEGTPSAAAAAAVAAAVAPTKSEPAPHKRRRKDTIPAWEAYYAYHEARDPRDPRSLYKDFASALATRSAAPAHPSSEPTTAASISVQVCHWFDHRPRPGQEKPGTGSSHQQHGMPDAARARKPSLKTAQDAGEPHWKAALGDPGVVLQMPLTAQQALLQRAGLMPMLASATEQRPTKPPSQQQQQQQQAAGAQSTAPPAAQVGLDSVAESKQQEQQQGSSDAAGQEGSAAAHATNAGGASGRRPAEAGTGAQSGGGREAGAACAAKTGEECVSWGYPVTEGERLRCAVFRDLHDKGFTMTGGAKFGADMLAYPGDPSLYHAQFTVRMVPHDQPLNPMLLKATARGSHAARKHSLLATIDVSQVSWTGVSTSVGGSSGQGEARRSAAVEKGNDRSSVWKRAGDVEQGHFWGALASLPDTELIPVYLSIAPETGFGSK
ncbi:MAG: hypothetical protein WDW38_010917 [Sanguina aurantia]